MAISTAAFSPIKGSLLMSIGRPRFVLCSSTVALELRSSAIQPLMPPLVGRVVPNRVVPVFASPNTQTAGLTSGLVSEVKPSILISRTRPLRLYLILICHDHIPPKLLQLLLREPQQVGAIRRIGWPIVPTYPHHMQPRISEPHH